MTHKHSSNGKFTLYDLMDVAAFQNLLESFTRLTGVATAIMDLEGKILVASGWKKLCTDYHRQNTISSVRCIESDTRLANQLDQGKKYNIYKCKNGLIDVAVPIIINNTHVGNLFTGQFLFEPPDIDFFSRQAEDLGFEKEAYLKLLKEIPILSAEKIEHSMNFLSDLTIIIGNAGIDKIKLHNLNQDLEERIGLRTAEISAERNFSNSLINSLPGVMYLFDRSGHFIKWNRNFEIVTGYSAEEIKQLTPLDLFTSATDKQRIMQAIEKVFREGSASAEAEFSTKEGKQIPYLFTGYTFTQDDIHYLVGVGLDISDRIETEKEKERLIEKLQDMLSQVKQLSGFLPICASCKNIRDDEGYWKQIETYIRDHSEVQFSHSICPDCAKKLYPHLF